MQNLDLRDTTHNAKNNQEYIKNILNRMLDDYQKTKQERIQLALWEEEQEFTILGVIEMFTDDIRGYVFQAIIHDKLEQSQEVIHNLQKLKIFEISYFSEWYFSKISDYPKLKHYVETLDYLRLLLIEYIGDKNYKLKLSVQILLNGEIVPFEFVQDYE